MLKLNQLRSRLHYMWQRFWWPKSLCFSVSYSYMHPDQISLLCTAQFHLDSNFTSCIHDPLCQSWREDGNSSWRTSELLAAQKSSGSACQNLSALLQHITWHLAILAWIFNRNLKKYFTWPICTYKSHCFNEIVIG